MNPRAVLVVAALCVACAFPASASAEVRIAFAGGRVSINASNATISEILNEWSRVGGSKFVNLEKLSSGDRLTLVIENELESRAIETLLRSSAGYIIAPRQAAPAGPSTLNVFIVGASRGTMASNDFTGPIPVAPQPQDAQQFIAAGPPRPDDDGPVRRETPPAPQTATNAPNPAVNSSPVPKGTTQTLPGLGIVTSSQPGVVINSPATTRPRPTGGVTPTRPGGGGGIRR